MHMIWTHISTDYIDVIRWADFPYYFYTSFSNITVQHSVPILCTEHYMVFYTVHAMWTSSVCHASQHTNVFA